METKEKKRKKKEKKEEKESKNVVRISGRKTQRERERREITSNGNGERSYHAEA